MATSQDAAHRLGWIGLGNMGLGMATNLQKHVVAQNLLPILYWNRTMTRGESIEELGGIACSSITELVQKVDIIFSSVSDDEILEKVVTDFLASGIVSGKILVDTSTVHPSTTSRATLRLSEAGATLVAAPAFGAAPSAAAGTVLFAAAGPEAAVTTVSVYLQEMGRQVLRVGLDPAAALLLKTTSNFLMAGIMELVAEAHVFAEKTGLGIEALEGLLQENFGPVVYNDSVRMTTGVYAPPKGSRPWSEVGLAIKDVTHGVEMARERGFKLPVGDLALRHLIEAKAWAEGTGRVLDSTSIYGKVREEAGLDFETQRVKHNVEEAART